MHFLARLLLLTLAPMHAAAPTIVDLPATGQWVDTGIDVRKGDLLSVTFEGRRTNRRAGSTPRKAPAMPLTLTGRIGTITFDVSSNGVAPDTGRLLLRVNQPVRSYDSEAATVTARISYVPSAEPSPAVVPLPNVVGMKYVAALRSLGKYGLVPRRRERPSNHPAGDVVDQSPSPGANVYAVKTVILGVSDGSLARTGASASHPGGAVPEPSPLRTSYGATSPAIHEPSTPLRTTAESPKTRARALPTSRPTPKRTLKALPARLPTIAVPPVVGFIQQDAAAAIDRANLHAMYRGAEPSNLPIGRITRTAPAAGTRLKRGALVGYWVASGGTRRSGNGWILWLVGGALIMMAALLGFSISNKMRLAKATGRRLKVRPSVELDGPTSFAGDVTMAGPTTHLRASVEVGEASFEDGGATAIREERNG